MKQKFKTGAASIYVVVFTVLLFSVIVVAFASLMISESGKTVNDTLAQAAYDSALAGVEDAKSALIAYRNCLDDRTYSSNCDNIIRSFDNREEIGCDTVSYMLGRNTDESGAPVPGEVFLQETSENNGSATEQAYTCVTLEDVLSDYRTNVSNTAGKVIPLNVNTDAGEKIDDAESITISWFSRDDLGGSNLSFVEYDSESGNYKFESLTERSAPAPPVLSVQFAQFPYSGISLAEVLSDGTSSGNNDTENDTTNRGQIWLVPQEGGGFDAHNRLVAQDGTSNPFSYSNNHKDGNANIPYAVNCDRNSSEFICSVTIPIPEPHNNNEGAEVTGDHKALDGSTFIIISMPYDQPASSVQVTMNKSGGLCTESAEYCLHFSSVQISVDSTGRANDVFSRVESRIEFTDTSFPFPIYALGAFGANGGVVMSKNFWASHNCWFSDQGGVIRYCNGEKVEK